MSVRGNACACGVNLNHHRGPPFFIVGVRDEVKRYWLRGLPVKKQSACLTEARRAREMRPEFRVA